MEKSNWNFVYSNIQKKLPNFESCMSEYFMSAIDKDILKSPETHIK